MEQQQDKKGRTLTSEIIALILMLFGLTALTVGLALTFTPAVAAIVSGAILLVAGIVIDWRV